MRVKGDKPVAWAAVIPNKLPSLGATLRLTLAPSLAAKLGLNTATNPTVSVGVGNGEHTGMLLVAHPPQESAPPVEVMRARPAADGTSVAVIKLPAAIYPSLGHEEQHKTAIAAAMMENTGTVQAVILTLPAPWFAVKT